MASQLSPSVPQQSTSAIQYCSIATIDIDNSSWICRHREFRIMAVSRKTRPFWTLFDECTGRKRPFRGRFGPKASLSYTAHIQTAHIQTARYCTCRGAFKWKLGRVFAPHISSTQNSTAAAAAAAVTPAETVGVFSDFSHLNFENGDFRHNVLSEIPALEHTLI